MRIGLIAMSGVRAWSEALNRAGLTMPGVIERGNVIASLPSLSLLTLAGMTGPEHDVSYHEIRDLRREGAVVGASVDAAAPVFNLVAISSMSAQVKDAYEVARHYRAQGAIVVMGGLHVTAMPEEAARHCDAVVVGEAEPLWERVLRDAERGEIGGGQQARVYRNEGEEFSLNHAPMPRFDLLDVDKYNRIPLQTARGCPHRCEFCASSILLTKGYKLKPTERVIAEVRAIKRIWERPFIELADDNSFCSRARAKELLAALRVEEVPWFTECDVSIAEDEELLVAMREAGCRQVLVGLESPTDTGLDGMEMRRNWKLRQLPRYEHAVRTIQSHGITVNGCFIVGLDGHTESVFDAVYDFAMRNSLYDVQITVPTAFPGTPMYERLLGEGRIIEPAAWERCTLLDVNIVPREMSVERLERGFLELATRLYQEDVIRVRREGFLRMRRAAG